MRTVLTVRVEAVDESCFDTQSCMLRLKGRNIEENQHVKLGAFHTIELELNRKFELRKSQWDSVHLDRIEQVRARLGGEAARTFFLPNNYFLLHSGT